MRKNAYMTNGYILFRDEVLEQKSVPVLFAAANVTCTQLLS